jgi:enamine deaminase RidA (YjgF/YER057c/UK114 family)
MIQSIAERLANMGLTLPEAAAPAANYVPFAIVGNTLYISGQLPMVDGKIVFTGHLGRDVDIESGQKAAEICAVNILAQVRAALDGDLERIVRVIKIQGFVASTEDFVEQHVVINGASNLLAGVLGDRGKHARAAVGMAALPMNAAVEVDAILEIS